MTALAGTPRLVRFTLRRDRLRLTVWVAAIAVAVLGSVASFQTTYPTVADRQARAEVLEGSLAAALWATNLRAYVDERRWPLALSALLTVALAAVAFRIAARRDPGAGMLGEGRARAHGSERLRSPFALAWRLLRRSIVAWALSLLALGAIYGSIATEASDLSEDVAALRDYYAQVGPGSAVDQFLALTLSTCALIGTGFVIQATTRLRAEETSLHAEALLATPVSRARWLLAQLAVAAAGGVVLLLAIGLAMGAVAALAFGLMPRATTWTWGVFGAIALTAMPGPLLRLPDWVYSLSPYEHTPRLPRRRSRAGAGAGAGRAGRRRPPGPAAARRRRLTGRGDGSAALGGSSHHAAISA